MPPRRCETAIVATVAAVGARDATVSGLWYCFILYYFSPKALMAPATPHSNRLLFIYSTPLPHTTQRGWNALGKGPNKERFPSLHI
jgi:hypothetical protein